LKGAVTYDLKENCLALTTALSAGSILTSAGSFINKTAMARGLLSSHS
jgi:hypothetical protein